jgi:radical SAM protein with 4Fe4S-binding SPASM domain
MPENVLYRSWLNGNGDKAPATIVIEPTIRCNMRCPMCDRQHKEDYLSHLNQEIATEILLDNITILGQMGVKQILILGGGEPFLKKDLDVILTAIKNQGIICHLWTNGTLFSEKNVEKILSNVDILTISLDSAIESEHDRSRGMEGSYSKIMNSLDLIKRYNSNNLLLRFHCVISKVNYKNLEAIIDLAKQNGIGEIGGAVINPFDFAPEYMLFNDDERKEIDKTIERFKEKAKDNSLNLAGCFNQIFKYDIDQYVKEFNLMKTSEVATTCFALWSMATIRPNGDVSICCFTYKPKIGNLSQNNFFEIWNSPKAKDFRIKVKKGDFLDSACRGCDMGKKVLTDIVLQSANSDKLLDRLVLRSR